MFRGVDNRRILPYTRRITSLGADIPFTTEWTVAGDAAARTITLPLVQNRAEGALNYDCVVDWGDDTTPSLVTSYNDANRIHTYALDGTYQVKITGVMEGWSFAGGGDCLKITKVIHFGCGSSFEGFKYLAGGFRGCSNLTDIGTSAIPASGDGLESAGIDSILRDCAITSVPANLFSQHPLAEDASGAFQDSSLATIPAGLFDSNTAITAFSGAFKNCPVTSIPSGLFDNNTDVVAMDSIFQGCSSITSIPSGLFDNNTLANDFSYAFRDCSITSVPSGLFDNNTAVLSFYGVFRDSDITSIPSGLFDNNTAVTNFGTLCQGCSSLASIPSGLFDNNTLVTDFSNCFRTCSALTSIPSGLFDYNTAVTNFGATFNGCTSLASIPSGLFDYNTAVTNFGATFNGCTSLASIPSGLFDNNTAATNISETFRNCTSLATVPSELLRYNTACTNFSYTFENTPALQQVIDLFYAAGEESTRFLNQDVNFSNCFDRDSFTGTQGTAPDLWNCSFGTGTPTTTDCWEGAGNSTTSLTNYASIPAGWK